MKIDLELKTPILPNFIKIKGTKSVIDLGSLDDEAYAQFEHQYTEELRLHWLKRKKNIDKTEK